MGKFTPVSETKRDTLAEAVSIAQQVGRVIIATSSAAGVPHVAVARKITRGPGETVAVDEWFCPGTVENAREGAPISVVAWDEKEDRGLQLLGSVRSVEEKAFLNGFGERGAASHVPPVLRTLHVSVEKILFFTQAPHDDREA
jgi:hypothetical protein